MSHIKSKLLSLGLAVFLLLAPARAFAEENEANIVETESQEVTIEDEEVPLYASFDSDESYKAYAAAVCFGMVIFFGAVCFIQRKKA